MTKTSFQTWRFCEDAEELRFETMNGVFMKDHFMELNDINEDQIGVMRSIKSRGKNRYVFVMDLDADEVTDNLREAASLARAGLKNYFDVDSFVKETGNTGIHVVGLVHFPWRWNDEHCRSFMANTAVTIWTVMNLKKLGVDIGKGRKRPYIDMCMYDRRRLVRAFSKHPKSGRYPKIIEGELLDTYQTPKTSVPMFKYHEVKPKNLEKKSWETQEPGLLPGNDIKHMPVKLKKLVAFTGDPEHSDKWGLVLWLRAHTNWNVERIAKWVWANCKWEDLDNWTKTAYHVTYTCAWSDNIFEIDKVRPVPRWCYDGALEARPHGVEEGTMDMV